jgi:hypothetical protein
MIKDDTGLFDRVTYLPGYTFKPYAFLTGFGQLPWLE